MWPRDGADPGRLTYRARRPSLAQSAELHPYAVRVQDVQTGFGVPLNDLQAAALHLGFDRFLLLIPVGDGVRDVIDLGRGLPAAYDEEIIAKRQAALLPVVFGGLHPEETDIEVASLGVIGHLIGDVVEVDGSDRLALSRRCRHGADGSSCSGRERQGVPPSRTQVNSNT